MQSELQQKRTAFAVSIRRESRNNKIRQLRNQYFQVIPQKYTFEGYIKYLDLEKDPKFAQQGTVDDPYILVRILLAKEDSFIRISFKKSINPDMIDEKLLPPQNSEFQLQEVQLPKQYPFVLQGALIQSITSDMEQDPEKYKKMPKQMQQKLIDFLMSYMKRNTYIETAKQCDYHRALLNFMQFFVSYIESPDLRNLIIKWVSGTQGFKLISHCLPGTFMRYGKQYRLYNLILKGLKHTKMEVRYEAIHVLLKCIQRADFDDIKQILDQIPEVYKEVINYFQKMDENQANQFFSNQPELFQSAREGGQCVIAFLDCYDEEILKCMEEGAGYVGAWLIMQNEHQLIELGLTIFNCISDAYENQTVMKAIKFLLNSQSIKCLQVWQRMGKTYEIVKHNRMGIKRMFVAFVLRVIANTQLVDILQMNSIVKFPENENLVEMLITMFIQNEDVTMRYNILQSCQGLCFYGQKIEEELLNGQQNQLEKNDKFTISIEYVMNKITNSEMINIMKELEMKQSKVIRKNEKNQQNLGELISLFFDYMEYPKKNNNFI